MLTPEQIAAKTDHLDGRANIVAVNRLYRKQAESHLWPTRNRFDATERAIRSVRKQYADYGTPTGLEYALALDAELSRLVNSGF